MAHKKSLQHPNEVLEGILQTLRAHMPELRERYGISSLGVFGSYVHGRQSEHSDLDILVEFDDEPMVIEFSNLYQELTALVGIKVDLVTKCLIDDPAIYEAILSEVIYV